jgi:hypothetical protein
MPANSSPRSHRTRRVGVVAWLVASVRVEVAIAWVCRARHLAASAPDVDASVSALSLRSYRDEHKNKADKHQDDSDTYACYRNVKDHRAPRGMWIICHTGSDSDGNDKDRA